MLFLSSTCCLTMSKKSHGFAEIFTKSWKSLIDKNKKDWRTFLRHCKNTFSSRNVIMLRNLQFSKWQFEETSSTGSVRYFVEKIYLYMTLNWNYEQISRICVGLNLISYIFLIYWSTNMIILLDYNFAILEIALLWLNHVTNETHGGWRNIMFRLISFVLLGRFALVSSSKPEFLGALS